MYAARGGGSGSCSTLPLPLRSTWERYAARGGGSGSCSTWVGRGDGEPGLIFVINGRSLQSLVWEL